MSLVAITHNRHDIGAAIDQALGELELEALIRDRIVAVKPNDTYASEENQRGVTQPDTLRAVLRHCKQFSPRELIVTGGAGAAQTLDVFRIVGLMSVVEEEGATFFDHNRAPFERIELPYAPGKDVSGPQRSVMVNPRVLDYETLIAVNQLKMHETATVTLALKNIAMSFPAADYYGHPRASHEVHDAQFFDDMHSFIAAMAKRFPIDLAVTVGHPAMVGNGPLHGYTFETGLIIASRDALAADAVGARLLGLDVQGVHHLWEAAHLGVGEAGLDRMEFPRLSLDEAVGIFTEAAYGVRLRF